jgi:hypothetical protein
MEANSFIQLNGIVNRVQSDVGTSEIVSSDVGPRMQYGSDFSRSCFGTLETETTLTEKILEFLELYESTMEV